MAVKEDVFVLPNVTGPTEAVSIDETICIGCNACANICRTQTILPSPQKGEAPLLVYPDECWFCGCCVEVCPTGAIQMRHPIAKRLMFKKKSTGEVYRIGQKNPPPKTYFNAPYGLLNDRGNARDVWVTISSTEIPASAVFTPEACTVIAKAFHEEESAPWKAGAAARLIGFDRAFLVKAEDLSCPQVKTEDGNPGEYRVIITETGSECVNCAKVLSAKEFVDIFHRACVSMYTAVQVWKGMPEQPFDDRCTE